MLNNFLHSQAISLPHPHHITPLLLHQYNNDLKEAIHAVINMLIGSGKVTGPESQYPLGSSSY